MLRRVQVAAGRNEGAAANRRWLNAVFFTGFLAARLVAAPSAAATGRCDVHPIGGPDGVIAPTDALVILRVAVGLLDSAAAALERADVAPPAGSVVSGVLIPGGDGEVLAEDALLCLRVAVGLLSIPGNLVVAIESLSPTRPVAGATATARVRVANDGDSEIAAGATVSLRRGSPFPGPAHATATTKKALPTNAAESIDIVFPAGDRVGDSQLFARVETPAPELSSEDNVDSFAFEVNGPPVANAGADLEDVLEQTTVTLDGSGSTDPNDDASSLTFAWSQVPGGPEVDLVGADTAKPTFEAPDISRETNLRFSLLVRDPDAVESDPPATVAVQIVPINDPPIANAGSDQSDVEESAVVTLMGMADDPNGDVLTTRWVQISGPSAVLDAPTETTTTLRLPNISAPRIFVFELRVTDDEGAVGTDTVEIAAIPGNSTPIARATILPSSSVLEQTNVTLDGTDSRDPDRDPITFRWRQIEGPDVELDHDGRGTATFKAPEAATPAQLRFELVVEDSLGASGRDEVELEVRPDPLHPASVKVRVTPTTAVVQAPNDSDPAMIVEVEVIPRDPSRLVPDGTLVWLTATPLGVLTDISGNTQLGLFTTALRPEASSGETIVRAVVPGTSASGEARPTFHDSPDEIGRLSLILDPPAVVRGSDETVQVVAVAYPADEQSGAVPDGTTLEFAASAGTFPSGRSAGTVGGVAVVPFEPPTDNGPVQITVTGSAEASATLPIVSSSRAPGALRLEADRRTVVAGGPGTTLSAFITSALPGSAVASETHAAFRAGTGLLEGGESMGVGGIPMSLVESDPLPRELDRPPLGDFPGPGDTDADGDGTIDIPGGRVAQVTFRHPDPVSEPVTIELVSEILGAPDMTDSIEITVVPADTDPGSVALTANRPAVISGGTSATLTASVDATSGDPVADGTPVDFAVSRGLLVPPSATTSDGSATSVVSGSGTGLLTARLRTRAQAQGIEDFLDLHLVPNRHTPASIELTLAPAQIPSEGTSDLIASAHVRKPDGSNVIDGTRVVFDFSSGTPAMTSAETVDGVARATLRAATEPGDVEARARVARSVVAGFAVGSFAPSRTVTATFKLVDAVGVGALSIDVPLPKGAVPVADEDGVQLELLLDTHEPPDQGIANEGTLAVGNTVDDDDIVSVGVITFQPITGTGPLFRMTLDLPPGADFDCSALQPVFFQASDGINEIPGVGFVCDHAARQDLQ